MAILDNAIWFGSDGFAETGTTTISEGGNATLITGTFSNDAWDATAGGTNVSDFGAAFVTAPITANYTFSNPVENLSFTIDHVNDDGASTYDDEWIIYAYDEDGDLIPAADVISGLSGLVDENVYANPDGSVTIESAGTNSNNVSVNLPGRVSELELIYGPGPNGTQTGGSGFSDFTFTVPVPPNFIVEGTAGNDTIDALYTGDPEGDDIDNLDHSDGSNADSVQAGAGDDVVLSGAGNDTVNAGTGNDSVEGGDGNDSLFGFQGDDTLEGQAGDDTIFGADGSDTITGGSGDDTLDGDDALATGGADSIDGGSGNDQIIGDVGNDTLIGGAGNDTVYAGDDADSVSGGDDDDLIYGQDGNDTMQGDAGQDTLFGGAGADDIQGGLGNDSVNGGIGNDSIDGGGGDDWVSGGAGNDTVLGGAGNDSVYGAEGNDLMYGDAGNDSMEGWHGDDTLYGGTGNDYQDGADGADLLVGQEGHDTLLGGNDASSDTLQGGTGNDSLSAGDGDDSLYGGSGDDEQHGGGGDDTFFLQNGFGNDTIQGYETGETNGDHIDASAVTEDLTVDLSAGDPFDPESGTISNGTGTAGFIQIENVTLGSGHDQLIGSNGNDSVDTGAGNDTVLAGNGEDDITTGAGDDFVRGGAGTDNINAGTGADVIEGGVGNDVIDLGGFDGATDTLVISDGDGTDEVTGFEGPIDNGDGTYTGRDQLDVSALTSDGGTTPVNTSDVVVTDDGGGNAVLTFPGGEQIVLKGVAPTQVDSHDELAAIGIPRVPLDYVVEGTDAGELINAGYGGDPEGDRVDNNDNLAGNNDDSIRAGGGNDTIGAGAGNDSVGAGSGDDQVFAETGNDTVLAGAGNDSVLGEAGDDSLIGDTGNDSLFGGDGNDVIEGGADEDSLRGEAGNDTIQGGDGNDYAHGGHGDDSIEGGAGDDNMHGWFGNDTIAGEAGNDYIDGDLGEDLLSGGDGNDTIVGGFSTESDTLLGGAGDDSLDGQAGDDLIEGGTGDDEMFGADGDDTFALEDGFGNDTITGGETDEFGTGDTLDLSATTTGVTVDLSNANPETGTVSDGTATAQFTEIENIVLGGGDDTLVLADGSGADTVQGFTAPTDNGDGTFSGNDLLDVTGMTDAGGAPVNTDDVTVSDDGGGNAVLSFPNGESLTLIGVAPAAVTSPAALAAMGIPGPDYIVEGTAGNDTIDAGYAGDPEGDRVDAGDNPAGNDDDRIEAGAGDDSVEAGAGNDHVEAGTGNDHVDGGAGNDTIQGLAGNDTVFGGAGDDLIDDEFGAGTNGSGNDSFDGGAGNDEIYAGTGDDTVIGGDGDDLLGGEEGTDLVFGGADSDTISVWGPFDNDTIDGGEAVTTGVDYDEIDASGTGVGVTVTHTGNEAGTITDGSGTMEFSNIEGFTLTDHDDSVAGAADGAGFTVDAGAGNDSINGGSGNDVVTGGAGNDTIVGGLGDDNLSGGTGDDVMVLGQDDTGTGGDGDDIFYIADYGEAGAGTIEIVGGEGDETNGDTFYLGPDYSRSDITFTNTDDDAGGLSGTLTMNDGTVVSFTEIENIICFTPGAKILTSHGERAVETLSVGDKVVTRDHGLRPIRWIGKRTVKGTGDFAPIQIKSSIMDGGRAPLLVSPQHRILFTGYRAELLFGESEVLIPAKHLVDGQDVTVEARDEVTYIHIMFDRHEVIYAEGIATESFHAGDMGLTAVTEAAREELFAIFPELRSAGGQHRETARTCLKKHEAALLMEAVRAENG